MPVEHTATPDALGNRLLWAAVAGLAFGQAHLSHGLFAWLGAIALGVALQPGQAAGRHPRGPDRRWRQRILVGAVAQAGVGVSCWGFVHYGAVVYVAAIAWLSLGGALFGALLAAAEPSRAPRPYRVALAWIASESLMTLGPWSFPLFLGGSQAHLPLRTAMGLVGALGLGGLMVGFGAALARPGVERWRTAAVGWLTGIVAVAILGAWQPGLRETPEPLDVAVVQGGVPNWVYGALGPSRIAERLLEARYAEPPAPLLGQGVELVVLPETALRRPALVREGSNLTPLFEPDDVDGFVLLGAPRLEWSDDPAAERPWNAALLFTGRDATRVVGVVDKARLAPITESSLWARGDIGEPLRLGPDERAPRVAVLICFESMDPWLAARRARDADVLVILTNDAGFEESPIGVAHERQGWSRAVELGRPLVRAAQAGRSLIVDPHGDPIDETELFETTTLRHSLRPTTGWTWFSAGGRWLGPGAWLVLIALAVLSGRFGRPLEV